MAMRRASSISHMLLQLHYSFPALSAFAILIFLFILVKYWKKSKASKFPPGPPKLPLIGNLHQLNGPLPHHNITNLSKKYGPVMQLQVGEKFVVVISSPEAAKEVLKTKETHFAQRPAVLAVELVSYDDASLVFAPYGDYWRQLRKLCVFELLSAKRVQSFRSIREKEVWNLIESISTFQGVAINLSHKVFAMTSNVTSQAAFGLKCKDQSEFMSLIDEAIRVSGGFNLPDLYPSLKFLRSVTGIQPAFERIHKKIDKILNDIVHDHKVKRKSTSSNDESVEEDLLDVFLKLQDSNQLDMQLTTNHIKAVIFDIFSGGTETSATTMEWAMSELLRNPRVMEKAQAEVRQVFKGKTRVEETDIQHLDYLRLVIKETLRLHPTSPLLPRGTREKCEISGYEIPAKAKILINTWAIGRDPNTWIEPDCFKPERFHGSPVDFKGTNFEFIPFGAGRRMCPGISFATANIELALAQMLYHFDWKLADGIKPEELDMSECFGLTARKKHNLHLIPTIYVPFNK